MLEPFCSPISTLAYRAFITSAPTSRRPRAAPWSSEDPFDSNIAIPTIFFCRDVPLLVRGRRRFRLSSGDAFPGSSTRSREGSPAALLPEPLAGPALALDRSLSPLLGPCPFVASSSWSAHEPSVALFERALTPICGLAGGPRGLALLVRLPLIFNDFSTSTLPTARSTSPSQTSLRCHALDTDAYRRSATLFIVPLSSLPGPPPMRLWSLSTCSGSRLSPRSSGWPTATSAAPAIFAVL